jgi:hypothetical protein
MSVAIVIPQGQFDRQVDALLMAALHADMFFLGNPFALFDHAQVVTANGRAGVVIKKRGILLADDVVQGLADASAHILVGILVTQIAILDEDARFNAVENGVEPVFHGAQTAGAC